MNTSTTPSPTNKALVDQGQMLPLMEHFYTIQGEGAHTGQPAYFLRLGGCDVGCTWCDVKESWEAANHPLVSIDQMVESVKATPSPNVVITGGEPTLYNLEPLTQQLQAAGLKTWIETSGTNELTGNWHWVCFSPKRYKAPVPSIYDQADELKMIIYSRSDLRWALEQAEQLRPECRLFIQPEWSRADKMMPLMVDFVKTHTQWTIALQTHKFLQVP